MQHLDSLYQLTTALHSCTGYIGYKARPDELPYTDIPLLPHHIFKEGTIIPCDKYADPLVYANTCIQKYKDSIPCIFIPGTAFDRFGTRHGRGGGWFDRFLSFVPKEWVRIGIIQKERFSTEKLTKESWDKSVDWVLVYDALTFSWEVIHASLKRY